MERPLAYIGYAFNFSRRDKQHRSGATNTFQCLFPEQFSIVGTPLTYFAAEGEAKCAELLFTLLMESFALGGKGFNLHDPGVSTISNKMRDKPHGEIRNFWAQRVKFREEMGLYSAADDRSMTLEKVVPKPGPATAAELKMHEADLAEAKRKLTEKLRSVNFSADACQGKSTGAGWNTDRKGIGLAGVSDRAICMRNRAHMRSQFDNYTLIPYVVVACAKMNARARAHARLPHLWYPPGCLRRCLCIFGLAISHTHSTHTPSIFSRFSFQNRQHAAHKCAN
jgi:hypothetical protein